MAFGFNPRFEQTIELADLTPRKFLALALETCKELAWSAGTIINDTFCAYNGLSMSSYGEEIRIQVSGTNAIISSRCTGTQIYDWGKNAKNVRRFLETFEYVKKTISDTTLEEKMHIVDSQSQQDVLASEESSVADGSFFSLFIPKAGFYVTPILLILNIVIFIAMVATGIDYMSPDSESLLQWGANYRPLTLDGGWYRLLTSTFLHIGFIHLLMNMYALLYIGVLLEPRVGTARYLSAYILSGIAGSLASLWWHVNTVSAGASGAVFGMYGMFIALLVSKMVEPATRKHMLSSMLIFVGYNLLNGIKGNIDNAAHIGGLAAGFIIGLIYANQMKSEDTRTPGFKIAGLVTICMLICSAFVYSSISNDIPKYEQKMKEFAINEGMALEVYKMNDADKDEIIFQVEERGLYYWDLNIKILSETLNYSLPEAAHERTRNLIRYCELRKKSYTLILQGLKEDTEAYAEKIEANDAEINKLVDDLLK